MENAFAFFFRSAAASMPCSCFRVGSGRMRGSSLNQKDVRGRKQQELCCQKTADQKKNTPNRAESLAELLHPGKKACVPSHVLLYDFTNTISLSSNVEKPYNLHPHFGNKIVALALAYFCLLLALLLCSLYAVVEGQ